jgi:hypothetical protein
VRFRVRFAEIQGAVTGERRQPWRQPALFRQPPRLIVRKKDCSSVCPGFCRVAKHAPRFRAHFGLRLDRVRLMFSRLAQPLDACWQRLSWPLHRLRVFPMQGPAVRWLDNAVFVRSPTWMRSLTVPSCDSAPCTPAASAWKVSPAAIICQRQGNPTAHPLDYDHPSPEWKDIGFPALVEFAADDLANGITPPFHEDLARLPTWRRVDLLGLLARFEKAFQFSGGADRGRTDDLLNAIQTRKPTAPRPPTLPFRKTGGSKQ